MESIGPAVLGFLATWWWALVLLVMAACYKLVLRFFGVIIIPKNTIGIVDKKFVLFGSNRTLPDGQIIALNGEAGIQADPLPPGIYYAYWPWQYSIALEDFTIIEQNQVGVVEAQDGKIPSGGRVLGKKVDCDSFQDTREFLIKGGERGPQIAIVPPGTYRINTAMFSITMHDALEIPNNMVGVVETKDGKPLPKGEIAGREIEGHDMFQDGQAFITNGGFRGTQEQVMLAGRYFVNPRFVSVKTFPMTEVPIANAGVVIAYIGGAGEDVTGATFKHGNLVQRGNKGVWVEPLDPGKYPINPLTHRVENVPTANVVLNWATGKTEAHNLDANLSTIKVRSSDGFTFNLDVSQIIHVPRNDAPKVIARFGTMGNLVTQVLEPTIGNYFRNAAQGSDVIGFLKERQQRQSDAKVAIATALEDYNVQAVDTLIGDITPPEALMKTLTDRKIAEQEQVTYETQRMAEVVRKELEQAKAQAATQANVVTAQREVEIADFDAQSAVKKAEGEAKSKTINAQADAEVMTVVGNAEGTKITAVGKAEAEVIRLKTEAVGQTNYATIEVGKALANSGQQLVPQIIAGGGEDGNGSGLMQIVLGNLVAEDLKKRRNGHVVPVGATEAPKAPSDESSES